MQEGWGSGGDEMNLGTSQWEDEDGDMWNNAASQESSSSCSSWGNASKKGLQKVGTAREAWKLGGLYCRLGRASDWCKDRIHFQVVLGL